MKRAIFIAALLSCTNGDGARKALLDQGFTNITVGGWTNMCGDDSTCTEFEAIGPSGRTVHGAVGCGFGCTKGCTIRTR